VDELAAAVTGWLGVAPDVRARAREGMVGVVRERFSWDGVARGILAAAGGELDRLSAP
jgi:hypothetical protein